jgi:hypothetical protein
MSCFGIKTLIAGLAIAAATSTLLMSTAMAAATADDYKAAYAAAEAANKQAGALRDQWVPTQTALDDAKKAADGGNFDQAVASAKEAEALAKASIYQATSEKDAWKALEIH